MFNRGEEEEVLHEFPKVGRYRVRTLSTKAGVVLDVREYVEADKFVGFTRRGIRLKDEADLRSFMSSLERHILEQFKS